MVSMQQYLAFRFVQEFYIKMFLPTPSFAMTHYLCPTVQFPQITGFITDYAEHWCHQSSKTHQSDKPILDVRRKFTCSGL